MISDDNSAVEREDERQSKEEKGGSFSLGGIKVVATETEEETSSEKQTEVVPATMPIKMTNTGGRRAVLKIVHEKVKGVSKDLASFRRVHYNSSKRLERQIAVLRDEVSALKSIFARETTRVLEKQESLSTKILSKVGTLKASKSSLTAKKSKSSFPKKKSKRKK